MKHRRRLRACAALGALFGYGCLAAFLFLVGLQTYRWFRDGEWTHVGILDALRSVLTYADSSRVDAFVHWLDAPVDWLGVHRVFEVVPASLALFVISIAGNCIFIFCTDRLDGRG